MTRAKVSLIAACAFASIHILARGSIQLPVVDAVHAIAAYASAYGEQASVIVASEHYSQTAESNASNAAVGTMRGRRGSRTLVSDFAIVKTSIGWAGFRDVQSVDGKDVRDRGDRLVRLLTAGADGIQNARRVSDESARYNIGFAIRNLNVPTMALFLFAGGGASRFQFAAAKPSPGETHLAFREKDSAGLVHRKDGEPVPLSGEVWARPDGTIVRTLLRMSNIVPAVRASRAEIDVTYGLVPQVQMWLPETMTELYESRDGPSFQRATGRADYSNYRRFETSVKIK